MSSLADAILREAEGESIEYVVIGDNEISPIEVPPPRYAEMPLRIMLPWEEARPWLDYKAGVSMGPDGTWQDVAYVPLYAWTRSAVIVVTRDSYIFRVPRHPTEHESCLDFS